MLKALRAEHGTVVAYLALFAALATGGAYAADKIGSNDIEPNAVKSRHVKNGQVKPADLAERGAFRAVAEIGRGVTPEFETDTLPERGFDSVTQSVTGVYCVTPSASTGLDPVNDPPIITFDYDDSSGENFTAMWDGETGQCADGTYEIQVYDAETGAASNFGQPIVFVP